MPEFALVFHSTRSLSPEDLARRNDAARDWAIARKREGILHSPYPLQDEGFTVSQGGVNPITASGAVAAVLIVEAADLSSAVELVKGHPGLAFGTQIDVRPVKPVVAPQK
ncbi:MAG TPA: hypothetical protein VNO21_19100 [Polyangiaceae bacterium]|nr:hypothetical protein [Polyangiaceae bacterium]